MRTLTIEAQRLEAMLELAGVFDQKQDSIQKMFSQIGMDRTIEKINSTYDTNVRIGDYIIASEQEQGFWSNDFGWSYNKTAATGYTETDLEAYRQEDGQIKPTFFGIDDATFVQYDKAQDFDA